MATVTVTHAKVTTGTTNDDVEVDLADWNDDHVVAGLENVDNTSDANKPVSTATQTALDAKISSSVLTTRGDIIYRNVTAPARLAKGAANTLLTMGADDPAWATLSALLDAAIGSTRGMLLLRGSSSWGALAIGTSTYVLTSDGTDAAWAAASGGSGTPGGSNTEVQYNNAGAFDGISGATTDGTTLTLVAPVLGAASATSINKVAVTAPATSATLTIANGKTLTASNTLTFTGTDGTTIPFGTRTRQVFTSGSGTYTTPANVKYINVRMIGGGAGGAGGGTSGGAGGNGGNSTFSTATATGGTGGIGTGTSAGGGGVPTGGDMNITGGRGGNAQSGANCNGGNGGAGAFGGIGALGTYIAAAVAGTTNTGGGGGGGGNTSGAYGGGGGGSGGYLEKIITSPSASYSYAVGAAGTAGSAGTGGNAGAAGGSGIVIVEEFYQ